MGVVNCPVCHRPMTKYDDGYRCMNIKAPEHATVGRASRTGPGRPRKDKKKGTGK